MKRGLYKGLDATGGRIWGVGYFLKAASSDFLSHISIK
jgi:hypothetical protein